MIADFLKWLSGKFSFVFNERVSTKTYSQYASFMINIVLAFVVVIQSIALVYLVFNKKVFMQPPFIVNELTEVDYSSGKLKKETLDDFAIKFLDYTENLTPENAERDTARIKPYLSLDFHNPYSKKLAKRTRNLRETNSIRTFHKSNVDTSKGGEMRIKGVRMVTSGDAVVLNARRTIVIYYKISNTKGFQIINIKELSK